MISLSVADFLAADPQALIERLAFEDMQRFRNNEAQQLRAWEISIACLREVLGQFADQENWHLVLEYPMRRLGRRIDAVLLCPRAIFVLEFKAGAASFDAAALRQVEDYALDLEAFHSGSRRHPIVPVLVATEATPRPQHLGLLLPHAQEPLTASRTSIGALLQAVWARLAEPTFTLATAGWDAAAYRPVPGIVDAACTLYSRHNVEDIGTTRADAHNLTTTTDAIHAAIAQAQSDQALIAVFVTGIPGAGKTLCGLNAVFGTGRDIGATFLTGNPTLVHVLREALARDAAQGDRGKLRAAKQRTGVAIQQLPAFRDEYVRSGQAPPERVIVIDEAQRAWAAAQAVRKSASRDVQLSDSEPGHILDIMARHTGWAVVVCLVGGGQEIHDGEGGLAEWGDALASRPAWQAVAAPQAQSAIDARQRLPSLANLKLVPALHLDVPMRSLRNPHASAWVDALLRGDVAAACAFADELPLPFLITRDVDAMRRHLRATARGERRAGLIGSSGGKRRRADGLGAEVPHMDKNAVAQWFLNRWPEDVRASDALETVATEFACQGLELDYVGLAWAGDLIRLDGLEAWRVRNFVGTNWQIARQSEAIANRVNTYRVLLTRARYETVIWVPAGDPDDRTRDPQTFNAIADFLLACGVRPLAEVGRTVAVERKVENWLL